MSDSSTTSPGSSDGEEDREGEQEGERDLFDIATILDVRNRTKTSLRCRHQDRWQQVGGDLCSSRAGVQWPVNKTIRQERKFSCVLSSTRANAFVFSIASGTTRCVAVQAPEVRVMTSSLGAKRKWDGLFPPQDDLTPFGPRLTVYRYCRIRKRAITGPTLTQIGKSKFLPSLFKSQGTQASYCSGIELGSSSMRT